jgi:cytochrome c nitrite reductase small subunit
MILNRWAIPAATGILVGFCAFGIHYTQGASYLRDDPAACVNCHAMNDVYDRWRKGSHGQTAVCNDCHTPAGLVPKWTSKALNGILHAWAFTLGTYPDNIRITARNLAVAEAACLKCHAALTEDLRAAHLLDATGACLRCHRSAGH